MKYIFNWVSGSGGDFILGLRKCILEKRLNYETTNVSNYPSINKWTLHLPDAETEAVRMILQRQLTGLYDKILNLPETEPGQSHSLCKLLTKNSDAARLLHNNSEYNVVYLKSDDAATIDFITQLCIIKNNDLDSLAEYRHQIEIENRVFGDDWSNNVIIEYKKVFIDQDTVEIKKLFSALGIGDFDVDKIVKCINLYNELNQRLLTKTEYGNRETITRLYTLDEIEAELTLQHRS